MYKIAGRIFVAGILVSVIWSILSLPFAGYTETLFPLFFALVACVLLKKPLRRTFWLSKPPASLVTTLVGVGLVLVSFIMAVQFTADLVTKGALSRYLEQFPSPPRPESAVLAVLILGFLLPGLEELFFRGFLLSAFSPEEFGPGGHIWLPVLIFTLLHPPVVMPSALIMSLFAAQAVTSSNSIVPAMVLHSVNNLVGQGFDYLYTVNKLVALTSALTAMGLGVVIIYVQRRDFLRLCRMVSESWKDYTARFRETGRKVSSEWSYVALALLIVLNIIAFFFYVQEAPGS